MTRPAGRFKLGTLRLKGGATKRVVRAPDGTAVLRYLTLRWSRVGNLREFGVWLLDGRGRDGEQIISTHGGLALALLRYLNGEPVADAYAESELRHALPHLDRLRARYSADAGRSPHATSHAAPAK